MENSLNQYHFDLLSKSLKNELVALDDYIKVNHFLTKNNWLFVSPLYFQGIELSYFLELSKKSGDHKKQINELIFRKFFNLNWTASFIDGYCKRCQHIEPFLQSIEHSLVLSFQKDYEGAIKTLIPIIEGILRKYLNLEQGFDSDKIQFKHLRKSFESLRKDLISKYSDELLNYSNQNGLKTEFTEIQYNELLKLQTEYYEIWFSFIINFIDNSFYMNTNGEEIGEKLNRHSILHEYGLDISYNLENYIKVYFVINFLTWIFLQKENKSVLNEIKNFRFLEKATAYKNIIKLSDKLIYDKHLLYKEHKSYNQELLREKFIVTLDKENVSTTIIYKILRFIDNAFWIRKLK